jgi:hypothetical protein
MICSRGWKVAALVVALGALAACAGKPDTTGTPPTTPVPVGSGVLGGAPTPSPTAPPGRPPATRAPVKALTCTALKNAHLGSPSVKFNGYPDYIPLADGIWSGEDGASVELQKCGIGDLDGDGARDGIASIMLNTGGTGRFFSLAVWRNVNGQPVFTALLDLGDRNPVEKIAIAGRMASVVYLTRTPDQPMAALNIRRTAIFTLSGSTLVAVSQTDEPYSP